MSDSNRGRVVFFTGMLENPNENGIEVFILADKLR